MPLLDRLRQAEIDVRAKLVRRLNRIIGAVVGAVTLAWQTYPDIVKQAAMSAVQHAPWWLGVAGIIAFFLGVDRILKPTKPQQ